MNEPDADGLKHFRAEVFGRGAADYDAIGRPVLAQLGQRLVELIGLREGDSVLDVCTGRGAVLFPAAEAVGETGRVVGVDLAAEMVALTAARVRELGLANVSVQVGDAENLSEFADGEFDCAACAFGIFFLPDPKAALREFVRVVRPGGVVALSSWGPPDARYGWYPRLREELGIARVGLETQDFETPDELRRALESAGLAEIDVAIEPVVFSFEPDEWWRWLFTGAARATIETLSPAERERFRRAAFARISEVYAGGPVELRHDALLATARKPPAR